VTVAGAGPSVGAVRLAGTLTVASTADEVRTRVIVEAGDARCLRLAAGDDVTLITSGDGESTGRRIHNLSSSVVDGGGSELCAGTFVEKGGECHLFGVCEPPGVMPILLAALAGCHLLGVPVAEWRALATVATAGDTAQCRRTGWTAELTLEARTILVEPASLTCSVAAAVECSHERLGIRHVHTLRRL